MLSINYISSVDSQNIHILSHGSNASSHDEKTIDLKYIYLTKFLMLHGALALSLN